MPKVFEHDEVPPDVKNAPRLVPVPPANENEESWPRLGDVPGRPKNLTSPAEYKRVRQELQRERAESEVIKQEVLGIAPDSSDAATQKTPSTPSLTPPQFLAK